MRLPIAEALLKLANLPEPPPDSGEAPATSEKPEKPWLRAVKAVGGGTLAFGAGTAAGYGAQKGVEKLFGKHLTTPRLTAVAPILGGAMGLAYNQYKSREAEELRNALKSHQEQRARSVPAQ